MMQVQLRLYGVGSLKDKRRVVKSAIERIQSRFNVSISEIEAQDSKVHAIIGICATANDSQFIQRQLEAVKSSARRRAVHRLQTDLEIYHWDTD
jgi:uncharacterized protein YlxP (DUF503 family)